MHAADLCRRWQAVPYPKPSKLDVSMHLLQDELLLNSLDRPD